MREKLHPLGRACQPKQSFFGRPDVLFSGRT
jgi:hypothetical protein